MIELKDIFQSSTIDCQNDQSTSVSNSDSPSGDVSQTNQHNVIIPPNFFILPEAPNIGPTVEVAPQILRVDPIITTPVLQILVYNTLFLSVSRVTT